MPAFSFATQVWFCVTAALVAMLMAGFACPRRFVRGGTPFPAIQLLLILLFLMLFLISPVISAPPNTHLYRAWFVASIWSSFVALWLAADYAGLVRRVVRGGWRANAPRLLIFAPEIKRPLTLNRQGLSHSLGTTVLPLLTGALSWYRAPDLAPIARDALIEQTGHGIMVLDKRLRVVNLNRAAQRLLAATSYRTIGQDVSSVLSAWPELLHSIAACNATSRQISIEHRLNERCFDVSISPLLDRTGASMGTLLLWLDVTEMRAAQAEVDRQRSALAALAEREQVGRELHDGLVQVLASIKMQAQAARDALEAGHSDDASAKLGCVVASAQVAHDETRGFLLGAKLTAAVNSDFWATVTNLAERYRSVFGLSVEITLPECALELNLDPMTRVQLLRIISESLANVRRHAGVSEASLRFVLQNSWLQITVHDDGSGFIPLAAPSEKDGHFGLSLMCERARAAGGCLDVVSTPGQGTTVFVQVPLDNKDRPHAAAPGR